MRYVSWSVLGAWLGDYTSLTRCCGFLQNAFRNNNNQCLFCVRSNHHILNSNIRKLVYFTRWPASNDPVADLKVSIENLLRLLEVKIQQMENPDTNR